MSRVVCDPRGFSYTVFFEDFNRVTAAVNTGVNGYLIDAHFGVMASYQGFLREFLVSQKAMEKLARELFSIGWLRWHVTKIYRQIQMRLRRIYVNMEDGAGGRGNNDH